MTPDAGSRALGIRWTIGDVSRSGFEALRLSIWGAFGIFGPRAAYAVCVNTVPVEAARRRTGSLPSAVVWHDATGELPAALRGHLDARMAEGVGWKFAPPRYFKVRRELALDNDCILWAMPPAIANWLADPRPDACLLAEDVRAMFGQFAHYCGPEARNSGIRGLQRGFEYEREIEALLSETGIALDSELDEQGLQCAVLGRHHPHVVSAREVTICSPTPPHATSLGRCGAHFVGLNARRLPWRLEGRPAEELVQENWGRHRPELYRRVGIGAEAPGAG